MVSLQMRQTIFNYYMLFILIDSLVCFCDLKSIVLMVEVICHWRKWWSLIVGRNPAVNFRKENNITTCMLRVGG